MENNPYCDAEHCCCVTVFPHKNVVMQLCFPKHTVR